MSNQQIQKVKVKNLAHVGLWATDVPQQARFYRQVLGLDLRLPGGSSTTQDIDLEEANVFLALGEEHHSLGLFNDTRGAAGNGRKPAIRTQLHHLSFEVDTDAELAALAARLNIAGVDVALGERDGDPEMGDTLWFSDPDGNSIEISVASGGYVPPAVNSTRRVLLRPYTLQHVALYTPRLEEMVDFYTEALGFDISDWLLRECVWLRCNNNHHTLMFLQGKQAVDHIGYSVADGPELLHWADYLSRNQIPVLWGPGRHGAGNDLFLRFADAEGLHIELSAELQQYYDRDVTTPPRLWHTREMALNLWGAMPSWIREEVRA
ncbi:MAG: VOC family protein [Ktedonobacteraceae bacterium]|nr:VOC family protein [Ktedonobacteraceae bacterium]